MNHVHRRGLFGGALALAAVPVLQAAAQPLHPDAELLELGRQLTEVWACEKAAWVLAGPENDYDGPETIRARALGDDCSAIASDIEELQAVTGAGLLVKLQAFQWCRAGQPLTAETISFYDPPPFDMHILAGLLQDLAAMGRIEA